MVITRLTRRFSRRALPRRNLVYYLWRFVANGIRTGRALTSRSSCSQTPAIGRELTEQGIVVGPTERFLTESGQRALSEAAATILHISRSENVEAVISGSPSHTERKKEFLIHLVSYPDGVSPDDPLLKLALDRKLLEIVSVYLGLWPCLYSVGAWLNYPTDAPPELSQLWHRDPEDLKLIKVFIYLVDVDERCGPFTYIPKTHPFGAQAAIAQNLAKKKRLADDQIAHIFPPDSWRVCTGPANTMILADTVGYHRGGKPTVGRRVLVTFTYTSGTPITGQPLGIRGNAEWLRSDIQKLAVRWLPDAPPPWSKRAKKGRTIDAT